MLSASLDLYLTLAPHPDRRSLTVELKEALSTAPLETAVVSLPFDSWHTAPERNILMRYIRDPLCKGALRGIGATLGKTLIPRNIADALFAEVIRFPHRDAPVNLYLDIEDSELAQWPWEYALLETSPAAQFPAGFLGRQPRLRILRFVRGARQPEQPASETTELKILIAWANPRVYPYSHLSQIEAEKDSILKALSTYGWKIDRRELPYVSPSQLRQGIQDYQPDVLHLICHGDDETGSRLLLEQEGDSVPWLQGTELAGWLDPIRTRLVVFSACSCARAASAVVERGIPAALAMQLPFRDRQSGVFFGTLYERLASPASTGYASTIADALGYARETLGYDEDQPDWGAPTLWLSAPCAPLFEITPPAPEVCLPERSAYCVGREAELNTLHRALFPPYTGENLLAPRIALAGIGGIGKSTLAYHYALRYQHAYPDGVYWIKADPAETLKAEYASFGFIGQEKAQEVLSLEDQVNDVRKRLQKRTRPTLLIFDNVKSEAAAILQEKLIPVTGPCRVLVTTREADLLNDNFHRIDVASLHEDHALAALAHFRDGAASSVNKAVSLSETEEKAARAIVRSMGGHPLAMSLIGGRIGRDLSFTEYLEENDKPVIRGALNSLLRSAVDSLRPDALQLLRLLSLFSGNGISRDLLFEGYRTVFGPVTKFDFLEILRSLVGKSLISYEGTYTGEALKTVGVHEVVREFAFIQTPLEQRTTLLVHVTPMLIERLQKANGLMLWKNAWDDTRHAYAILEHLRAAGDVVQRSLMIRLLLVLGEYQYEHSHFISAVDHFTEALQHALQNCSNDTRWIADIQCRTAQAQQRVYDVGGPDREMMGDLARSNAVRALELAERIYPSEVPDLARFYQLRGYVLKMQYPLYAALANRELGEMKQINLKRAEPFYLEALKICLLAVEGKPENDPNRANVASSLNYLGVLYEELGMLTGEPALLTKAREYLSEALRIDEHVRGAGHTHVAIRLNNLGRVLARAGEYRQALELHTRAEAIYREAYGGENMDVAGSLFYMALAHQALGHKVEAKKILEQSLSVYERLFGAEHPLVEEKKRSFNVQTDIFTR